MTNEAFTISEFCIAHRISRSHYYNLRRAGLAPREMQIGNITRINREAAADWRRKHEPTTDDLATAT